MSRMKTRGEGGRARTRFGLLAPPALAIVVCLTLAGIAAGATQALQTDAVALVSTTITLEVADMTSGATPPEGGRLSSSENHTTPAQFTRLVALPECSSATLTAARALDEDGVLRELPTRAVRVRSLGRIREQTVGVLTIDANALDGAAGLELDIETLGGRGPRSVPAGPFTEVCRSAVAGYEPETVPSWRPPVRDEVRGGSVTYCYSAADCAAAGVDFLFVAASDFAYAPAVNALAAHHASYLGLNVGIVSMAQLNDLQPETLRAFIQTVYESESAEHFGDGRLGFVLLLGDAFADDNQTVLVPAYYGYGGDESASDHYYACVSGDDDFEDVMLGRLSVGNLTELARVVAKCGNYMPLPEGFGWRDSMLLIGGLYYTTKSEYVELFDDYDELIPDDKVVERIYRHDYANDPQCAADVVDEFNEGHLFTTFVGDGWIHEWHRTLKSTDLASLENVDRLPVVLSMACMTGWFDNTTYEGPTGTYDCFAELLVNAENGGAIACFAAPRPTDGGVYRTLTKQIFRAAFEEHCVYLGELFATAKLLHLQSGGAVEYARHFNLFGDPALVYAWDVPPATGADLVIRPHEVAITPEYAGHTDEISVTATVTNQTQVDAPSAVIRITFDGPDGQYVDDAMLPAIPAWSDATHVFVLPASSMGSATIELSVDPDNAIVEIDESNNIATFERFIYPLLPGFPVDLSTDPGAPAVLVPPDAEPSIVVQGADARVWSLAPDGSVNWQSATAYPPIDVGPESATASGDLDGDGELETAALRRMGLAAYETDGTLMWAANISDPVGRPAVADADGDGDGDIIVTTRAGFGGQSGVSTHSESNETIWTWAMPDDSDPSTAPAVGDLDLDGRVDVAFGTDEGGVWAISAATGAATALWPVATPGGTVNTLVLADDDLDGRLEVIVGCDRLVALSSVDGSEEWSYDLDGPVVSLAVADLDGDGPIETIAGTESGTLYRLNGGVPVWSTDIGGPLRESFVIADVDGDGLPEIVVATEAGSVFVVEADGSIPTEPMPIPGGAHTPFAADIDSDGALELCVTGESGLIFVLDLSEQANSLAWAGLGSRSTRTGILTQPFSGEIAGAVILSGEYYVTDDLIVAAGGQLTLAPGTELTFSNGPTSLVVLGSLAAAGTESLPVLMRGSDLRGGWAGLQLQSGSSIHLERCSIDDATIALRGQQATVTLSSVTISDAMFGVDLDRTVFNATACEFTDTDSSAIRLTNRSSGTIRGCSVLDSGSRGIDLRTQSGVRVVSTLIQGVSDGQGIACTKTSNAVIDSCTVVECSSHGILASASAPRISDCTISENGGSGVHSIKVGAPRISRSTITGNYMGIYLEQGSTAVLGSNMYPDTGYNSIFGNTRAAVANYNGFGEPVFARWNWWGSATPYGRLFVGYVVYNPWLDAPPSERPTLVGDDLPTAFALHPNTPNPFNPVTTLRLDAPAGGGDVEVAVYNVAGRRIALLHSGYLPPGEHALRWTGTDEDGNTVASGVYFARMVAPGYTRSVRMLLLK
jgi:hypothetical protein